MRSAVLIMVALWADCEPTATEPAPRGPGDVTVSQPEPLTVCEAAVGTYYRAGCDYEPVTLGFVVGRCEATGIDTRDRAGYNAWLECMRTVSPGGCGLCPLPWAKSVQIRHTPR